MNKVKSAQRPADSAPEATTSKRKITNSNSLASRVVGFLRGQRRPADTAKITKRKRYRPASIRDEVTEFLDFVDKAFKADKVKLTKDTAIHLIWMARKFVKIKNIRGRQKEQFLTAVRREINSINEELYAA